MLRASLAWRELVRQLDMYILEPARSQYDSLLAESIAHIRLARLKAQGLAFSRPCLSSDRQRRAQAAPIIRSLTSLHVAVPKPTPLPLQDPTHHVPPSSLIPHTHLDLH